MRANMRASKYCHSRRPVVWFSLKIYGKGEVSMKYTSRLIMGVMALLSITMGMPGICTAERGDVNGDGVINVFDALLSLQYAVKLYQPPNEASFILLADVAPLESGVPKGNNVVDVFDALAILRHAVGLDPWNAPAVTLITSMGTITITLFPKDSPETVKNFLTYVQDGFYDGLIFHRVVKNFMIQGGGFDITLTQKTTRDPIVNEAGNGLSNRRGTVAMARTKDENSATSQFFINTVNNPFLDKVNAVDGFGYAVFGEVTGGMDVVDAISKVQITNKYSAYGFEALPVVPIIIQSANFAP